MATGGIGGFLAAHLIRTGHEVASIARGAHLAAIQTNGLTLLASSEETNVRPWIATADPRDIGEVDVVIFAVKGDDLERAAEACRPLLGAETVVVPFLNGVEAAERLAAIIPPKNVADGVAYVSATVAGPGIIEQTGNFNRFVFAERDNRPSSRLDALRDALGEAGIEAPPSDNIDREVWAKFILFSAVSGVTTAARCRISDILDNDRLGELFRGVIAETAALGRARGVALPAKIEDETWELAKTLPRLMRASTAVDLEFGRPLETEWISGAVARLSDLAGLEAPINRTLFALLSPYRMGGTAQEPVLSERELGG
ncbi:MAG: 2-dehydropantoate 2-reductase [Alphaproteobacteria bacterium]|jgi:2-dehydropantoate 2-reductase